MSKRRAAACLKSLFLREGPNDVFHIVDAESFVPIQASDSLNALRGGNRTLAQMKRLRLISVLKACLTY